MLISFLCAYHNITKIRPAASLLTVYIELYDFAAVQQDGKCFINEIIKQGKVLTLTSSTVDGGN